MKKQIVAFLACSLLVTGSATTFAQRTPTPTGGALGGAALGAIAGQLIGKDTKGTLIGAGIGALAGMGWGAYKQKQQQELQNRLSNSGIRVTSEGDAINLNLPGGVTFPTNQYQIKQGFYRPLGEIAAVLNQYPESSIQVAGFTDNTGEYNYNMQLSERRAYAVANFLIQNGVDRRRIIASGYGPEYAIANNNTADGRSRNRRVEIKILPPNAR